ncbi:MAG TPA: hypothetical protein PLI18_05985, partial [Pirellulaceae bacterium]|nr:hypothetical protein [Pirellulaceae bacterium]
MASDSVSASVVPSETRTADDNQRSTREVCVYRFEAVQQRDGTTQLQRVEIEQWLASHTDYRLLVETVNGRISLRCACLSHFDEAGYRFEPSVGDASRAETGRRQRARIDAILDAARRNGSPSEFALATDLLQQRTGLVAAPNRLALLQVIRLLRRLAPGLIRIGVAARDFPRALALKAMYEQRFGKDRDIADTKLAELRFGNCLPPERIDAHGFREQHDRSALIFGGRGLVASQLPVDLLVLVDPEVMIYRRLSQPAFDGQRELICSAFQVADYIDSDHSPGAVRAWIGRHRDLTSTERAAIRFWMPGTVVSVDDLWRRQRPFEVECREIAVPTGSGCRAQRRHRFRSAVAEAIAAEIRTQQRPETGRVVVLVDDERTVQCVRSAIGSLRTRRGLSRPTVDVVTVGEFRRLVKQQCDVLHVAVTWPFDLRLGRFLPFPDPPLPSLKVVLWAREGHRFPDDPVADLMFGHFSVSREKEPKPAEYGSNVSRDARRRQRAQSRSQIRNDRNTNARRPGSSLDRDALKDAENAVFANDTCGPDGIRPSQLSQFDRTGLRNYLAGEKSWPVRRFQIGRFVPGPYRTVDIGGRQIHIRGVLDRL